MAVSIGALVVSETASADPDFPVTRRFVDVGGRRVHVRMMGSGPPALFIHSSPANSSFVIPEMASVADQFTCFAFDTPGFGLSDALPGEVLTIAQLADALAATLDVLAMPPCPVFGCHTGASIALELAVRHPERVTGLMLDSLCCFTAEEFASLEAGYFTDFPVDALGGHYSAVWTRFRDQSIWFPWFARDSGCLNENDLAAPTSTDRWVTMFFDAKDTYAPAYRAAMAYRNGQDAISKLSAPLVLTSIESDMLYGHLDRVTVDGVKHQIVRVGNSVPMRRTLTAETLRRFRRNDASPQLPAGISGSDHVLRQFIDVGSQQVLVRTLGDQSAPPLFLIHDVPGSGMQAECRMAQLAASHFVLAMDLPGCGETPMREIASLGELASFLWDALDALQLGSIALSGIGLGSSLALEMALIAPRRTQSLLLDGLLLPEEAERAELALHFAPPVSVRHDGSHWFGTWQMIRDMGTWWPWYRPLRSALRRVASEYSADALHRRTCETLRQPNGFSAIAQAFLRHDAAAALNRLQVAPRFVRDSRNPVATAYAGAIAKACPEAEWVELKENS